MLLAAGMLRLSQLHTDSGYLAFVSGPFLAGIGMGLSSSTRTTAIVDSLGPDSQGAASTMNDTTREVGSAIGTAIRGTVFAGQYRSALPHSRARLPTEAAESVRHSSAGGLEVATPMGAEVAFADDVGRAFTTAFTDAMPVVGVALVVTPQRARRSPAMCPGLATDHCRRLGHRAALHSSRP
ncbi:hypothetical protein [Streptomyces globisporus]|uniref:hypothetical protein n=1 Tax=Streptomyces globisporus TaxID=1908 RepID=UPI003460023F